MTNEIGITGSTGVVGGLVARELAGTLPLRLLVRDASRAPELPDASVAVAQYADEDVVRSALDGVRTLLMVSAAENEHRVDEHRAFVRAAAAAGVEHVVYTSFVGAAVDSVFTLGRDHFATEQAIRDAGLGFTFLRDCLYADFLPLMVGEDDVLRGPAGDGVVAAVARADVARIAALVLRDPAAHAGRTYDLTGPAAVSLTEVASVLSAISGRRIRYHDETLDEAYASRASYGAAAWQVDAWVSTYTAIAQGEVGRVSSDFQRLTGALPESFADVARRAAHQQPL